jgi:hypothetical protein
MERRLNPATRGPKRPRPYRLDAPPEPMGACCAPRGYAGWFFAWVERRRELYAYASVGSGSRAGVEVVLNSLRVAPRR